MKTCTICNKPCTEFYIEYGIDGGGHNGCVKKRSVERSMSPEAYIDSLPKENKMQAIAQGGGNKPSPIQGHQHQLTEIQKGLLKKSIESQHSFVGIDYSKSEERTQAIVFNKGKQLGTIELVKSNPNVEEIEKFIEEIRKELYKSVGM